MTVRIIGSTRTVSAGKKGSWWRCPLCSQEVGHAAGAIKHHLVSEHEADPDTFPKDLVEIPTDRPINLHFCGCGAMFRDADRLEKHIREVHLVE